MKLLLKGFKPLIYLKRFFSLLKDRWLGVQEILEISKLVWFRPLTLVFSSATGGVLRNDA
jgi:hypothetical protein